MAKFFSKSPTMRMSRAITPTDVVNCAATLSRATGEKFTSLDRCEGGFCVVHDGDDKLQQIRFYVTARTPNGAYMLVSTFSQSDGFMFNEEFKLSDVRVQLHFKGTHGHGVPWTRAHAKKLTQLISRELGFVRNQRSALP